MIGHFSEPDGTMFQLQIPNAYPEYRLPLYARAFTLLDSGDPSISSLKFMVRRYRCVRVSGDIAFYDRVVDIGKFE